MKEYFVVFKGSNKELATTEFSILWNLYFREQIKFTQRRNTIYSFKTDIILEKDSEILSKFTFTNGIYEFLWEGNKLTDLKNVEVNSSISRFAVEFKTQKKLQAPYTIQELARPVWDLIASPRVDLKNPEEVFTYMFFDEKKDFVLTRRIFYNSKEYLRRMPKLRPVAKPYTLKSDMARAALNLLNIKEGIVLDPFCGIGGILLEAKDLGFEIIANDISWPDLKNTDIVFEKYFENYTIPKVLADSSTQFLKDNSIDGIVTDIPYGKSSRRLGLDLYRDFLQSAQKYLKKGRRLVVIYANFIQFKDLALEYFDEVVEIDQYINKSMTRHILVLENSK